MGSEESSALQETLNGKKSLRFTFYNEEILPVDLNEKPGSA